ncbi:protein O-mannosyl-transferase family [Gemmatimonas sp.]|uniref:protein O-mannosyl-transferase family n=1 Tax=Gemmatimonas sp. TaxID=1962908 RepID=UPI0039835879
MTQARTSPRDRFRLPSSIIAPVVAIVVLLSAYLATAAPDLTFWDATELVTAARTLGIPHPPGTPLWVLMAHVISTVFSNSGPARAVTMLSVLASALVGGVGASMLRRWIGSRGAVVGAVIAGTMTTVWSNATETEVYAVSLLVSALMLAAGEYAGRPGVSDHARRRARALIVFMAAIAVPLHLSVLVALPAALVFAWNGPRVRVVDVVGWGALSLLGVSAVAVLPLLYAAGPDLASGHPDSLRALVAVLRREQYEVAGLLPRMAPLWLQLGNVFEWADWQVAFGVHPFPTPSVPRTLLTLAFVWLAVLGLRTVWRHEARAGRAMLVLLLSGTVGVAFWLNMRAGPTFGGSFLPVGTVHEARERDYFFVLGFWSWGLLAGAGLSAIAAAFAKRLPAPIAALPLLLGAVPLVANRSVMDRTREPIAMMPRTYARLLLDAIPQRGVLLAGGDNDTFPLWYLQQVEDYRSDVTVVTVPLLGATWYRESLAARRLLPPEAVRRWPGLEAALRSVMIHATEDGRDVRVSTLLTRADRDRIDRTQGWALQGLVYAPSASTAPRSITLDAAALARSRETVPLSVLAPIPAGADPAVAQMQALLRCTQVVRIDDPLLVSSCNAP